MAIFAHFAYAAGADVQGVLLARFVVAGAALAACMVVMRRPWPRGRTLAVAIGMGAVGYVGQAACYFSALNHASAGLVALLLYAYPTLVCVLAAAFLHERLTRARLALLAASFGGIGMTIGGGHGSATGIALGLAAAVFYAIYIVVGARELRGADPLGVATVVCLAAAATLGATSLARVPRLPAEWWGWLAVAAIALVSTVVAIVAFFAGLARVGAANAAIASTLEPVVTVALGWAVLHEELSALQLLGGAVVLAAAAALTRAGGRHDRAVAKDPGRN